MSTGSERDLFDRIRSGCRSVAERAQHVHIRTDRIGPYAASLPIEASGRSPLDTDRHYLGTEAETVAYFVILAAINFGSGYFPYLLKRPGMSGYFTIASSLADRFRGGGPVEAEPLRATAPETCARWFSQDLNSLPVRELMGLYARSLNDLGEQVVTQFDGRFERLIGAADHSAARLVAILSAQPFFRDEVPYRGLSVPFYKRAQLLASDLALAFDGGGPGRFDDLDRLTLFADNLVPHVLRKDGLLEYSASLAAAIEHGELLRAGSEEETEIRACAVDCVERIGDAVARSGRHVTSRDLDQLLWHRGQGAEYKAADRHRTRTVFY